MDLKLNFKLIVHSYYYLQKNDILGLSVIDEMLVHFSYMSRSIKFLVYISFIKTKKQQLSLSWNNPSSS